MDLVSVKCVQCDAKLGSLTNLWAAIGKKHITPAAVAEAAEKPLGISESGSVRVGDAETLVGGCELRDAECTACRAKLGQKCLKSPSNHVLKDGQVIFRTASIVLRAASDLRRRADFKVQRVLKLRNGASPAQARPAPSKGGRDAPDDAPSRNGSDITQIQANLRAQQEQIRRISAAGLQAMSSLDTTVARFELKMRQLDDTVETVRADGQGQRDNLSALKADAAEAKRTCQTASVASRLDRQFQTTDRVVTELRQVIDRVQSEAADLRDELTATQHELKQVSDENAGLKHGMEDAKQLAREGVATSKMYASEVTSLRREIKLLRSELAYERAHSSPTADSSSFSSRQLEILASNISKIGNRASQIESLQMEFELFRTRVQRLEARASSSSTPKTSRASIGEYGSHHESAQSRCGGSSRRKRPSLVREDSYSFDTTPPKRIAISSGYPSLVKPGYASAGEAQPSSPLDNHMPESPV